MNKILGYIAYWLAQRAYIGPYMLEDVWPGATDILSNWCRRRSYMCYVYNMAYTYEITPADVFEIDAEYSVR